MSSSSLALLFQCMAWLLLCWLTRCCYVLLRIWLHRLHLLPLPVTSSNGRRATAAGVRSMIILGSGGHTGEMLAMVDDDSVRQQFSSTAIVAAANDLTSIPRCQELFQLRASNSKLATGSAAPTAPTSATVSYHRVHRSRNVGQSYISSIATTLRAFFESASLVYRTSPQLILTNGPGTALPLCYIALLYHIVLFRSLQIVYIESYCRVTSLSLTGWLLYPICTRFIVQWPQLHKKLPSRTTTLAQDII